MKSNPEAFESDAGSAPDGKESDLLGHELTVVFREEVRPEDCENVRRMVVSSGFFSPEEVRVAVELVEDRLARGLASGYHFLFAEHDGAPVGYTCFGPVACTKGSFDLYWIAVHNDLRGLGIGRKLIAESLRIIGHLGGNRVYIETSSRRQYEATRSFYGNNGFEEEAVLKDFYDRGEAKFIYVKALK
jgi:ribosomal protein S18 acetylase RimI-like enzyme